MEVTHYQSSKGPVLITAIAYPHLKNAAEKLRRDGDPKRADELAAMDARLAVLAAEHQSKGATEGAETDPAPAPVGHNAKTEPKTFAEIKAHIEDLYLEAKNWLDGKPIETQPQADEVSRLKGMIVEAAAQAEKMRRAENEPFDTGKAEVQARYAELISDTKGLRGKTVLARAACERALTPWLVKLDKERQAVAEAARAEAEAKRKAAEEAARSADLRRSEQAEEIFAAAKAADREATSIERGRAAVGGGEYRRTILRDNWTAELTDGMAALRHLWQTRRADLEAFALRCAMEDVRAGKREVPGFRIWNDQRAA